jgi:hypothetical protein
MFLHFAEGRCVTLQNILQFFTGASRVPGTGFDETPKISFMSKECFPEGSTCSLTIKFPLSMGCLGYEDFEAKMDYAILGSYGFGTV